MHAAEAPQQEQDAAWGIPVGTGPQDFANEAEVWRPPSWAAGGYDESLAEARRAGTERARLEAGVWLDSQGNERYTAGRMLPQVQQREDGVQTAGTAEAGASEDASPGWESEASDVDVGGTSVHISPAQRSDHARGACR